MLRNVYCEQIVSSGIATIVDNDFCNEAEIPRPSKFCSEDSEDEVQDSKPEVVHTYFHLGPKQFPLFQWFVIRIIPRFLCFGETNKLQNNSSNLFGK